MIRAIRQLRDNIHSYGLRVTSAKVARRLLNRLSRPAFSDLPRSMHVETTMCCNLNCEYCVLRREWRGQKVMSLEQFKALAPYIRGLDTLCLSGLAEPLMNPRLCECIAFVRGLSPRTVLSIMTNATLLDTSWCERLVESGLHTLGFSIDSADPAVNASIRRGSERASVLDNIRLLIETRRRLNARTPDIFAITVLQRKNYRELPAVVAAVAAAGVTRLEVNTMEPFAAELLDDALLEQSRLPDDLVEVLERAWKTARDRSVHLRLASFAPSRASCFRVESPLVMANGDVTACSVLAYDRDCYFSVDETGGVVRSERHAGARIFGNAFATPFEQIWRSREYREFRDSVKQGQFPPECRDCLIKHDIVCVTGDGDPGRAIGQIGTP